MSTSPCQFYGDDESLSALRGGEPRVLLLGSYQGCSNYGDILQLKGAIRWHRRHTRFEPVVVVNGYLLASEDYLARLRAWFGVRAVLLWSEEHLDAAAHGLRRVEEPPRVPYLHVYGGGFLNAYWGERMLHAAESLHATFGVGHYVLSGQQVQREFAPRLTRHFEQCRPVLVGGRDPASTDVLASCGAKALYSFDDAAEVVRELAGTIRVEPGCGMLVHLNASGYTIGGPDATAARLDRLVHDLRRLSAHLQHDGGTDPPAVTLLSACSDARVGDIRDTLAVVVQLEDRFPFRSYRVLDLAKLALEFGTGDAAAPEIRIRASLGLSCSYHAAMFCNLLGVPTYLETANDYYRQKATGLKTAGSLDEFLRDPAPAPLTTQFEARGPWLAELEKAYAREPAEARPQPLPASGAVRPWPLRSSFWTELQSARDAHAAQQAHVEELAAARDRVWETLQQANRDCEQQRTYIAELTAARDRELRRLGLQAAAARAELEYLREELAAWQQALDVARAETAQLRAANQEQQARLDEWWRYMKELEQAYANAQRALARSPYHIARRIVGRAVRRVAGEPKAVKPDQGTV